MGKNTGSKAKYPKSNDTHVERQRKGLTRSERDELNALTDELLQKCSTSTHTIPPAKEWEVYNEIWHLIEKIRGIENAPSRTKQERKEMLKPFLQWLNDNNALVGSIELVELPVYGFSVKATEDIKEGDLLFSIPRKVMITIEEAKTSKIGSFLKNDPILKQMPNVGLAMYLLFELYDSNSFWKPYLNALPANYDTVMYWTPSEVNELKGSPAYEEAMKMCKNIGRQYSYFYTILQKSKEPSLANVRARFTYDDYRWAVSTVMTRQNMIPDHDGHLKNNALIPLWDFCNHQIGQPSTDYHVEDHRSVCHANHSYHRGEQVFIFYGHRSCCDQLIHNGFVDVTNPEDFFTLKLGLGKSDPLARQRAALLAKLNMVPEEGVSGPLLFRLRCGSHPVDGYLLAFLRIFCMNQDNLNDWLASENSQNLLHEDCGIDTQVEDQSWAFLTARCQLLFKLYPTTKDEDLALLETNLNPRHRMCVLLRVAEKRILHSSIEYALQKIKK